MTFPEGVEKIEEQYFPVKKCEKTDFSEGYEK